MLLLFYLPDTAAADDADAADADAATATGTCYIFL